MNDIKIDDTKIIKVLPTRYEVTFFVSSFSVHDEQKLIRTLREKALKTFSEAISFSEARVTKEGFKHLIRKGDEVQVCIVVEVSGEVEGVLIGNTVSSCRVIPNK